MLGRPHTTAAVNSQPIRGGADTMITCSGTARAPQPSVINWSGSGQENKLLVRDQHNSSQRVPADAYTGYPLTGRPSSRDGFSMTGERPNACGSGFGTFLQRYVEQKLGGQEYGGVRAAKIKNLGSKQTYWATCICHLREIAKREHRHVTSSTK